MARHGKGGGKKREALEVPEPKKITTIQHASAAAKYGKTVDFKHEDGSHTKITPGMGRWIHHVITHIPNRYRSELVQGLHSSSGWLQGVLKDQKLKRMVSEDFVYEMSQGDRDKFWRSLKKSGKKQGKKQCKSVHEERYPPGSVTKHYKDWKRKEQSGYDTTHERDMDRDDFDSHMRSKLISDPSL